MGLGGCTAGVGLRLRGVRRVVRLFSLFLMR
jgi:hypothetical protein